MTYQEQLTAMAERMARKDTGALYGDDVIPQYMVMATEALAFAAEQSRNTYREIWGIDDTDKTPNHFEHYLFENGLIPENQTTWKQ